MFSRVRRELPNQRFKCFSHQLPALRKNVEPFVSRFSPISLGLSPSSPFALSSSSPVRPELVEGVNGFRTCLPKGEPLKLASFPLRHSGNPHSSGESRGG